jgi:hypothetical protein
MVIGRARGDLPCRSDGHLGAAGDGLPLPETAHLAGDRFRCPPSCRDTAASATHGTSGAVGAYEWYATEGLSAPGDNWVSVT